MLVHDLPQIKRNVVNLCLHKALDVYDAHDMVDITFIDRQPETPLCEHQCLRGVDPREAVDYLVKNRADVMKLFTQMPMGEMSPGLFMKPMGAGVYRLEVERRPEGSKFSKLDVIWERGVCRLVLIS